MDLCVRRTPASDWEPRSPDVQAPGPSRDHTTAAQPPALNHRTRGRGWGRGAEARRCRHAGPKRSQAPPGDAGLTAALAPRTGKAPAPRGDARTSRQRAEQTRPAVPAAHTPARPEPTCEFGIVPSASPRGLAEGGRSGGLPGPKQRRPSASKTLDHTHPVCLLLWLRMPRPRRPHPVPSSNRAQPLPSPARLWGPGLVCGHGKGRRVRQRGLKSGRRTGQQESGGAGR